MLNAGSICRDAEFLGNLQSQARGSTLMNSRRVCGAVQQGGGAFLRMFALPQAHMTDVERVKTSALEMMALLY
jgi:hypothetical protein